MFDNITLSLSCPECKAKTEVKVTRPKSELSFVCSGCGKTVIVDKSGFEAGLMRADKAVADFKKALRKRR